MALELLLPFVASVAITIFLRRLDKSNPKLSQMKRYASKLEEEIYHTAGIKLQELKDASIDLEIQLKKSKKEREDTVHNLEEAKQFQQNLRNEKETLQELNGDLTAILSLAHETKKESESLEKSLHIIQSYKTELKTIQEEFSILRDDQENLLQAFQDKCNFRSDEILTGVATKIIELENHLESKTNSIDASLENWSVQAKEVLKTKTEFLIQETIQRTEIAKRELDLTLENLKDKEISFQSKLNKIEDTSSVLNEKFERFEDRIEDKARKADEIITEKMNLVEKKIQDRYTILSSQVNDAKEAFFEGLSLEKDGLRKEMEALTLETLARRDDIINESRRQQESVKQSVVEFQEKYLQAENKLLKEADVKKKEMLKEWESFQDQFQNLEKEMKQHLEESFKNLKEKREKEFLKEFETIEKRSEDLSDKITNKLKSVEEYTNQLKDAMREQAEEVLALAEEKSHAIQDKLDSSVNSTNSKMENMKEYWERELDIVKADTLERIQSVRDLGNDLVKQLDKRFEVAQSEITSMEISSIQKLQTQAEIHFSKHEEKLGKLNILLEEKLSKEILKLIDKGGITLQTLETKVLRHVDTIKKNIDDHLRETKDDTRSKIQSFHSTWKKEFRDLESEEKDLLLQSKLEMERRLEEIRELDKDSKDALDVLKRETDSIFKLESSIHDSKETILQVREESKLLKKELEFLHSLEEKLENARELQQILEKSLHSLQTGMEEIEFLDKRLSSTEEEAAKIRDQISDLGYMLKESREDAELLKNSLEDQKRTAEVLLQKEKILEDVESKFEAVETLLNDVSERHKQVLVLEKRTEELRSLSKESAEDLESLLGEADQKFERLSSFMDLVERKSMELEPRRGNGKPEKKDLVEKKRATILALHNSYSWSSQEISDSLRIEKSLVDSILLGKK